MSFHVSGDIGVWVAAVLTLCIFSFLYKDNPFYKFAEHLFVGVSARRARGVNLIPTGDPRLADSLAFENI